MNESEAAVATAFRARGFTVLRRGWPDLLVLHSDKSGGGGFGLELKGPTDKLSPEQVEMHAALERFGLPVLVSKYAAISEVLRKKGRKFAARPDLCEFANRARELERRAQGLQYQAEVLQREAALLADLGDAPLIAFDRQAEPDPFADTRRKLDRALG